MCNDCSHCRAGVEKDLKRTARALAAPDMSHDPAYIDVVKGAWCDDCAHSRSD